MRGSLAIWCTTPQRPDVAGHPPEVELHFNIWSGLPGNTPDVLDFGLRFKDPRTIDRLFLYIPGRVLRSQLKDLSTVLNDATSLSAVFNDTLDVGEERNGGFEVLKGSAVEFRIVKIDIANPDEVSVRELSEDDGQIGTVIGLEPTIIARMSDVGDHYIRIRLALSGELAGMLVSHIEPPDRVFLSSFYETHLIEFRVNEKRNYSRSLRDLQGGSRSPVISAIHYFLVRDLRVEIVQAHSTFRKMRRLEPGLWDKYLSGLGSPSSENMIIYHWRELAQNGRVIEDFIALTAFRQSGTKLFFYVFGIILLGTVGNATQSLLTTVLTVSTDNPTYAANFRAQAAIISWAMILLGVLCLWALPKSVSTRLIARIKNSKTKIWQKLSPVIQRGGR
jgi:hypothetical protein